MEMESEPDEDIEVRRDKYIEIPIPPYKVFHDFPTKLSENQN